MAALNRRHFLRTAGAAGIGLAWALNSHLPASALDRALARTARRAVTTAGTTLDTVATPLGVTGYRRLASGPGWPLVVRTDLAAPGSTRDDRRTPLASFVQFTDLHVVDAQSPARFEYLHPLIGAGAFRPQETLSPLGASALVRKVNSLPGGPFTGRPFDFVVTTGDNTDNHEHAELDWFLTALNGGAITPNTGDPARYEGVQAAGSDTYWNPDTARNDRYQAAGFPVLPGLLDAAIRQFQSPGLGVPWYCTFGNHDDSVVGTLPDGLPIVDALYTGDRKIIGLDDGATRTLAAAMTDPSRALDAAAVLASGAGVIRTVTPDDRRRPFSTAEFVREHLDPRRTGPGPVGHGFTANNADGVDVFYTFPIAPGVTGISLDTTTLAGLADGSIGLHQYSWLEKVLRANSSRYYDWFGGLVRQSVTDELFVLFSHHSSGTMGNLLPDRRRPLDPRLDGATLVNLVQRFPNVLAWVNGHTHRNEIIAHRHAEPTRSFWEINTASHVDFPQHARIIEITANGDGTVSLFTTLVEADSPYQVDYDDRSPRGLASLYRELSFNDLHANLAQVGAAADHNTELVLSVPGR
ncbi:TIGR03767 family metallophosphoesterase [Solihabitans fulvus]|uniref:TIGR03767 family metallophosphoesterase n=1 Tax=Solihabitans fulvus TaxID=1892852 RepID=A0A5B2XMH3_9PSEU|nr:TIGR03767 family metallophosphoesterase [Solihabitans fulvus]KAA2264593.1 TIGR03767 family metallophosphoesterase [Solihabitans fulvus]